MHLRIGSARVRRDAPWLPASWRERVYASMVRARFTPTEQRVAWLLCRGARNREIGEALYIEIDTVKTHITAMLRKTGTRDRLALVLALLNLEDNPCDDLLH